MLSCIRKAIEPYMSGETAIRSVRGRGYVFMGFDGRTEFGEEG